MTELVERVWMLDSTEPLGRSTSEMERILRSYRPNVVHAGPIQTATYLAATADAPGLTGMSWGYDLLLDAVEADESAQRARTALSRCRALIADCETAKRAAIDLGMDAASTVVLPWGVDVELFSPKPADRFVRDHYGIPDEAIVFFTNRSWEPVYRVDLVIEAFGAVARADERAWLIVAGDGSLATKIQAVVTESPAHARIATPGRLGSRDMAAHYRSSDLYVSASRIDGSSVSLLEAMACGLPAIVVDHPANREWIREGDSGWLFRRDDARDLATRMAMGMQQRDRWAHMRAVARAAVEQRADWYKNRHRIREAYEMALR